ncbi:hypothetical protein QNH14_02880 [Apirhabdus apintestini]|nr:hypothetical protein QNH14_02880 [Enterobacteriaceae bacterium CA-0114]
MWGERQRRIAEDIAVGQIQRWRTVRRGLRLYRQWVMPGLAGETVDNGVDGGRLVRL